MKIKKYLWVYATIVWSLMAFCAKHRKANYDWYLQSYGESAANGA